MWAIRKTVVRGWILSHHGYQGDCCEGLDTIPTTAIRLTAVRGWILSHHGYQVDCCEG